jgi:hypothetical protein
MRFKVETFIYLLVCVLVLKSDLLYWYICSPLKYYLLLQPSLRSCPFILCSMKQPICPGSINITWHRELYELMSHWFIDLLHQYLLKVHVQSNVQRTHITQSDSPSFPLSVAKLVPPWLLSFTTVIIQIVLLLRQSFTM